MLFVVVIVAGVSLARAVTQHTIPLAEQPAFTVRSCLIRALSTAYLPVQ